MFWKLLILRYLLQKSREDLDSKIICIVSWLLIWKQLDVNVKCFEQTSGTVLERNQRKKRVFYYWHEGIANNGLVLIKMNIFKIHLFNKTVRT